MANFTISKQAEEDLIAIYIYTSEEFGEMQAEKYFNHLQSQFKKIASNPKGYQLRDELMPE